MIKYKPIQNSAKIVFALCLVVLTIHYCTSFKFRFHDYAFSFWSIYLISFLLTVVGSKKKILLIAIGIFPVLFSIYLLFNRDYELSLRKKIPNSPYNMVVYHDRYHLLERHYIFEKRVAEKTTSIFYNPYSKIGMLSLFSFNLKIVSTSKTAITIEIQTPKHEQTIHTLKKN